MQDNRGASRIPSLSNMPTLSFPNLLKRCLAMALLGLPKGMVRWLAGPPVIRDGLQLDLQLQLLLKLQKLSGGRLVSAEVPVARLRQNLDVEGNLLAPQLPPLAEIRELQLAGTAGTIGARLYRPQNASDCAPALVFFHGGGYALGSPDSHDAPCRWLAAHAACVVISVAYRLAPEHPFPAGVDDALAAFRAVAARAAEFGIDAMRIAVGGDSAGGNFAAVVAQDLRGTEPQPCFQLLIYPGIDATLSFPSIDIFDSGFFLEKSSILWFVDHYLRPGQDRRDPRVSPLFGELAGLPPALVMTAGFDPLRDEGEAYAAKLAAAGVAVTVRRYEGLAHGFLNTLGGIEASRAAVADAVAALRSAFAQGTAV